MIRTLSDSAIFIDSSAVIALKNPSDQFHHSANNYFELVQGVRWVVMNSTTHETYTRIRYDDSIKLALEVYDWLKSSKFHNIPFEAKDEDGDGPYRLDSFWLKLRLLSRCRGAGGSLKIPPAPIDIPHI